MENFLIITPMGLESSALREIQLKHPEFTENTEFIISKGLGLIEFNAPLSAVALNYTLKCPTRILLRLGTRRCRDFPKLFNIIKKFNWRPFLKTQNIEFKITSHESRLIHTGRINESAQKAIKEYFRANALSKKLTDANKNKTQTIYLRLDKDDLTIALDTSGELLHKRGDKTFRGKAALRENIASSLLLELLEKENWASHELIDPMCGSGTFLFEANSFWEISDSREFSFQLFSEAAPLKLQASAWGAIKVLGHDNDEEIVKTSRCEFITNEDLFAQPKSQHKECVVISNPPYGKRIKIMGKKLEFFQKILEQIVSKYGPKKFGIIIPCDIDQEMIKSPFKYQKLKQIKFFNSGIWVWFIIWEAI